MKLKVDAYKFVECNYLDHLDYNNRTTICTNCCFNINYLGCLAQYAENYSEFNCDTPSGYFKKLKENENKHSTNI